MGLHDFPSDLCDEGDGDVEVLPTAAKRVADGTTFFYRCPSCSKAWRKWISDVKDDGGVIGPSDSRDLNG